MSDAFFGRIFHIKRELLPFGTVSLTTYFHADAADLAAEAITRVLAAADAKIFHKSYGDQNGELWSPSGRLLATPRRSPILRRDVVTLKWWARSAWPTLSFVGVARCPTHQPLPASRSSAFPSRSAPLRPAR